MAYIFVHFFPPFFLFSSCCWLFLFPVYVVRCIRWALSLTCRYLHNWMSVSMGRTIPWKCEQSHNSSPPGISWETIITTAIAIWCPLDGMVLEWNTLGKSVWRSEARSACIQIKKSISSLILRINEATNVKRMKRKRENEKEWDGILSLLCLCSMCLW